MQILGKILLIAGLVFIVLGIVIYFFGSKFSWLGNLPGDIKIERENFKFFAPITTMIFLSIFLSVIIWLIKRLF